MHELTAEDKAKRDEIIAKLDNASGKITKQQEKVDDEIAQLNDEINEYNAALKEADAFADEVVRRISAYYGTKSEGWKEEKGEAYDDWIGQWSNLNLSPMDLIDEIALDDMEHGKELAELPESPES